MQFFRTVLVILFVSGYAAVTSNADPRFQTANDKRSDVDLAQRIQGSWQGTINSPAGKLRLVLKVSKATDGNLKATLDSPDQGATDLPVDSISFKDSYLRFEMKMIQATFDGGLSRDGSEIAGQFRQGLLTPLVLKREGTESTASSAGFARGRINLEPCNVPNLTRDAGCAKYEVFEDRAAKTGRRIALNILVLPALSAKPLPDPLFVLAGGPGQAAAGVVRAAGDYLVRLRRDRDLVFVDQRGTGESNPLQCNSRVNRDEMRSYFADSYASDSLRECRAALEKTADLTLYTTPVAMDDLDEVRAALGYNKINLLGGSYGTFAGFVYLRQHPDRVRAAILEGVTPLDAKIYLPFAKGVEHSLERLFTDCAADNDCQGTFPNLRAEFKELTAKLDKQPVSFESTNLLTGKREQITMSRPVFGEVIRSMLYIPIYWRWLPLLIHEANKNNFGPLTSIAHANAFGLYNQIARGMSLSILCAEDIPFITEDEIKRDTAGTFYGDYRVRSTIKACEQWPKAKISSAFSQPVKSDAPVLMITGDLDPVAPPWLAAGALRFLPNGRHISIPNTGHYFRFECVDNLFVEFLAKASAKGLDDSCVKQVERPPFMTKLPPQLQK
ncbi:MAG: alpha/beta fold hydrolase [Blastocatellia bacterium]